MNRFELNTEELINLMMDRDTSEIEKKLILEELQNRPESASLINDYNQLQTLLDKSKNATKIPTIPTTWTNSIMEQVQMISKKHFAFSWFGKLKYALLGLLLLIPFGLYLSLSDNQEESLLSNNNELNLQTNIENNSSITDKEVIQIQNNIQSQQKNNNNGVPIQINVPSKNKLSTSERKEEKLKLPISEQLSNNNKSNLHTITHIEENPKNIIELSKVEINVIYNSNATSSNYNITNTPNFLNHFLPFNIKSNNNVFIIQTRGSYAITNPEKNFVENDFFGNTYNLGIFIDVYDNIFAGAEFGSEVFSQIFTENTQPGTVYEQSPTLFYFGLSGKYEVNQLAFSIFKPVGHLFVGGSSLGPLVKSNVVIQANLINNIGVFVGLEGSLLYYKNQNIWYNSGKLGLIGGVNIKF